MSYFLLYVRLSYLFFEMKTRFRSLLSLSLAIGLCHPLKASLPNILPTFPRFFSFSSTLTSFALTPPSSMSSESTHPGEITLHGMVSLKNRRPAPGKPNTYIYDATFRCSEQTKDGVVSFHHYIGQDRSRKLDDLYDI